MNETVTQRSGTEKSTTADSEHVRSDIASTAGGRKRGDATVSLHPPSFEEALTKLVNAPKAADPRTKSAGGPRSSRRGQAADIG